MQEVIKSLDRVLNGKTDSSCNLDQITSGFLKKVEIFIELMVGGKNNKKMPSAASEKGSCEFIIAAAELVKGFDYGIDIGRHKFRESLRQCGF
jgi:hypothetical protein